MYPTLHAIGLGPQLAELERICAEAKAGKHANGDLASIPAEVHVDKAGSHIDRWLTEVRDQETGASHLIHSAARLLMAAAKDSDEPDTICVGDFVEYVDPASRDALLRTVTFIDRDTQWVKYQAREADGAVVISGMAKLSDMRRVSK
jgi:hypothetical protein